MTFLLTDIEGSTLLWERQAAAMHRALVRHDELVRHALTSRRGYVFKTTGDGFCAAFSSAVDALGAALAIRRSLQAEVWDEIEPLRVRMVLTTGVADLRGGDYFGAVLNRGSRMLAIATGRQILLSASTVELIRDNLPPGSRVRDLGEHRVRGVSRPLHMSELVSGQTRDDAQRAPAQIPRFSPGHAVYRPPTPPDPIPVSPPLLAASFCLEPSTGALGTWAFSTWESTGATGSVPDDGGNYAPSLTFEARGQTEY